MAKGIGSYMEKRGTRFAHRTVPTRFGKDPTTGQVMVYALLDGSEEEVLFGTFDTVIMAIGRTALAGQLNLEAAGVSYNPKTGEEYLK
jgi:pyruvate/2-oxoglutarate dehydrogenase complex dihydrolipoamide dehydrogenase (E3) component